MVWRPCAFLLGAVMLLVACSPHSDGTALGGPPGPTSSPTPQASGSGSPTSSPSPRSTATATAAPAGTASLSFTVKRNGSSAKRSTRALPLAAAQLVVTINSVNGSTTLPTGYQAQTTIALSSAAGGNCTADTTGTTGMNCTVTIPAPPGTVNYTFTMLDSGSHQLATVSVSETVSGVNPAFTVGLNSIVASVTIVSPAITWGQTSSGPLSITYFDASGAQIVGGTFANTVTITDGETTSSTELILGSGTPGKSVTVTQDGDVVTFTYDGSPISGFTFTIGVSGGGPGGTVPVNPVTPTTPITFTNTDNGTISTDPNYQQPTLFFSTLGQNRSFTAFESGWSDVGNSFTIALDPTTCGTGGSAAFTLTSTDNKTFSVTSVSPALCKATVTGAPGQHVTLWLSVSTAPITIH
jgi:hypothetical protein